MDTTEQVLATRRRTHGEYRDHARVTQGVMRVYMAEPGWEALPDIVKETLHMWAHKAGRIVTGNPFVHDHYVDVSGYAMLIVQRTEDGVGLLPDPGSAPQGSLAELARVADLATGSASASLGTLSEGTMAAKKLGSGEDEPMLRVTSKFVPVRIGISDLDDELGKIVAEIRERGSFVRDSAESLPLPEAREQFERWMRSRGITVLSRSPLGTWGDERGERYVAQHVQSMWEGWQSRSSAGPRGDDDPSPLRRREKASERAAGSAPAGDQLVGQVRASDAEGIRALMRRLGLGSDATGLPIGDEPPIVAVIDFSDPASLTASSEHTRMSAGAPTVPELGLGPELITTQRLEAAISHAVNYHGLDAMLGRPDSKIAELLIGEVGRHLRGRTDAQMIADMDEVVLGGGAYPDVYSELARRWTTTRSRAKRLCFGAGYGARPSDLDELLRSGEDGADAAAQAHVEGAAGAGRGPVGT